MHNNATRFFIVLSLIVSSLIVALPHTTSAASTTYYVATDGDDANAGTLTTPFRTIQHAANVAQSGDTVAIRAGVYRETVTPVNNGREGQPITFQPYQNEQVTVSGADLVSSTWTEGDNRVWSTAWPGVYASSNNQSEQVFVDGIMVNLARWPEEINRDLSFPAEATIDAIVSSLNTGEQTPGPEYPIRRIVFVDAAFDQPDGRWDGAKIWVNTSAATDSQDGNGQTGVVIDTNRDTHEITIEVPTAAATGTETPGNFLLGKGSHYYLFDPSSVDGLLYDGEFWHDRDNKRFYLRTPDGTAPTEHVVEVKQRDYAFDLDGKNYITIKELNVFAASITTDKQAGNGKGNGNTRSDSIAPASNIVLDGLRVTYVSHFTDQTGNIQTQWSQSSGIVLSGRNHTIQNSQISWSAGTGLVVIGQGHTVFNNIIHDTNYTATDGGALGLGRLASITSLDHDIGYNTVYNAGVDGIDFTALRNSSGSKDDIKARIHHNLVYNTVLQSADSGAIKAFASDGNWVRIDHDIIYNTGGPDVSDKYVFFGIYLDFPNEVGEYVIDHNVVYNTPSSMSINGMKNLDIYNNTFIARPEIARGPIQANGTLTNVVIRNLLSNRELRIPQDGVTVSNTILDAAEDNDWFVDTTSIDMAQRSYQLAPAASAAIDTGADVASFNDATPPDIGAYEFSAEPWRAGATLQPAPGEPGVPPGSERLYLPLAIQ